MATDVTPVTGHAIDQERKKLKKVLHRFDLVFFTIAAFISLDTIAVAAAYGGGQMFIWLAFLIVVYLIPYGMIIAEMGSTFPVEGGPYVWTRMAFGRLAGSYTAVIYWGSNPVWIGGTLAATVVAAINSLILDGADEHLLVHRRRPRRRLGDGHAVDGRDEVRQVDRHHRHRRPPAHPVRLPRARRRLPRAERQARRAPSRRARPEADHRRVPRRHRPAAVHVRGLRALERRGRGDDGPAEGRPQDDPALRPHRVAHHRLDDPRRAARHERRRALERRRLHRGLRHRSRACWAARRRRSTGSSARSSSSPSSAPAACGSRAACASRPSPAWTARRPSGSASSASRARRSP